MASKKKKYLAPSLEMTERFDKRASLLETLRYRTVSTDFKGLDLSGKNFRHFSETGLLFENCDLRDADFACASLDSVIFRYCDLRYASFSRAHLRWGRFLSCDLRDTFFGDAHVGTTSFNGSRVDTSTSFMGANLDDLDIICVDNERKYQMRVLKGFKGGPHIIMGCRTFTLNQAWTHWQKNKGGVRQNYLDAIKAYAGAEGHKLKIVKV